MTSAGFRDALFGLGMSQSDFARTLQSLGDDRTFATVLRTVQALAAKDRAAPIPWSVVVVIRLMERMWPRVNSAPKTGFGSYGA